MDRINKLGINPSKIMHNNDLSGLKGGVDEYGDNCCMCYDGIPIEPVGYMHGVTPNNCDSTCRDAGFLYGLWECLV